jgi:hypothetical protein
VKLLQIREFAAEEDHGLVGKKKTWLTVKGLV